MPRRKRTDYIVVHHSATQAKADIGAKEIRRWHKDRGFSDIGYHYVIRRDGIVERGRPLDDVGAHVMGHNGVSIGICLVGGVAADGHTPANNYTKAQMESLAHIVRNALAVWPRAEVVGHRNLDPNGKPHCPMFDVREWWADEQAKFYAESEEE